MIQYEMMKVERSMLETLLRNGMDLSDVEFLDMYEDYTRLKGEGHKITYIVTYLSEQYECSQSTVYRVVKRMAKEIR